MIKLKDIIKESKWSDRKWGDPLPTLEDVMKEKGDVGRGVDPDATDANIDKDLMDKQIVYRDKDTGEDKTISVRGALKQGEDHPAYDDAKKMVDKEKGGNDKEEPKGKSLGGGDFERDFDDSEPEDKPFGGDTGADADFGMDDDWEDDEDAKAAAFADMEDEFGDEDEWDESVKVINGKQYKRISESVEPTVFDPFKEAKKQLGGLYTRMKGK